MRTHFLYSSLLLHFPKSSDSQFISARDNRTQRETLANEIFLEEVRVAQFVFSCSCLCLHVARGLSPALLLTKYDKSFGFGSPPLTLFCSHRHSAA